MKKVTASPNIPIVQFDTTPIQSHAPTGKRDGKIDNNANRKGVGSKKERGGAFLPSFHVMLLLYRGTG